MTNPPIRKRTPNSVPPAQTHSSGPSEQLDDVPFRGLPPNYFMHKPALGPGDLDYPRHSFIFVRTPTTTLACPHVRFVYLLLVFNAFLP